MVEVPLSNTAHSANKTAASSLPAGRAAAWALALCLLCAAGLPAAAGCGDTATQSSGAAGATSTAASGQLSGRCSTVHRFEDVEAIAKKLAAGTFEPPDESLPAALQGLDYDSYRKIVFHPDEALWSADDSAFTLALHHRGYLFARPVDIYLIEGGEAKRLRFSTSFFRYDGGEPPAGVDESFGFAGFRLIYKPPNTAGPPHEVASFLGASYFRAAGLGEILGASGRGVAVEPGLDRPEEFPFFRAFWIRKPGAGARTAEVMALVDGPRIAGAYRFVIVPGATTRIEVTASLFLRAAVEKLGVAPLTSMFWYGRGESERFGGARGQVHDSDGLLLLDQRGEIIFRPLTNPPSRRISRFQLAHPAGFGLVQRARTHAAYGDSEALYHKRPSVFVRPQGDWGEGVVELLELPAEHEGVDNIGAWWLMQNVATGKGPALSYSIDFGGSAVEPAHGGGRAVGYMVQSSGPRVARFSVEFAGGRLAAVQDPALLEADVTAAGGRTGGIQVERIRPDAFAASFSVEPEEKNRPVELRVFLKSGRDVLTETWSYPWQDFR